MTRAILLVTPKLWRDPALRDQRNLAIVMLRFGSKTPSADARPHLNYKDIA
jgi:transposase